MLCEFAEVPAVRPVNIHKYHDSGPSEKNCLPPLKEIHIVKLVQLYRKLQCSLYFRHDIIPLITCQKRRHPVNTTYQTDNNRTTQWIRSEGWRQIVTFLKPAHTYLFFADVMLIIQSKTDIVVWTYTVTYIQNKLLKCPHSVNTSP